MNVATTAVSIRGIGKRFGGITALEDVSFDVADGELHAICGENGAGKSTLMKILSGVLTDYEGELAVRGRPVRFTGTQDAEAAGISIIHQELNLVEELSAAANVFLGRERTTRFGLLNERQMNEEARSLFKDLETDIAPARPVSELRIGDQQLVEIAKALSLKSDVLIMDEPTSALTEGEVERLYRVIATLRERGTTILYISHKMDEVFRLADRITVLRDGRHVTTLDRSETSPREVTHQMVGREIENADLVGDRTLGDVVLSIHSLKLPRPGHAKQWRLEDIHFDLRAGEVLGFAGLMGAGRTELLECLFGTSPERPQGLIELNGRAVHFDAPHQAMKAGIALVTEDRKRLGLFSLMTVRENVTQCTLNQVARRGVVSLKKERQAARESVASLGIKTAGTEANVMSLSGGNQQKCIIARWLRTNPQVLLLDDPTRGVDVGAKADIYQIINKLARQGMAVIVTSSELPELMTLCDRILILCEGRLTGKFTRGEFTEQAIMEAATGGGAAIN
ncbi:sugar ABC transporter ATP-binding protein [Stratiformator vulcanicus]|uniref:Ribose import ATP-binding protein RbsA n=1 Tax=Stratiformator vulcanicus TaxID=2527980 RepID=A0A517QZV6_9PLAN|nr:sugar ABC transporter ATP-binding protein [Stratiformator vulcanicus]QDT37148.1 Ribose import ATP-binding protein RbsA [Stratiformator vulcanicus]